MGVIGFFYFCSFFVFLPFSYTITTFNYLRIVLELAYTQHNTGKKKHGIGEAANSFLS